MSNIPDTPSQRTHSSSTAAPRQTARWRPFPDDEALLAGALALLESSAQAAIRQRGRFRLVLAGGNTPRALYRACRQLDTDWSAWHIYFGDERCLPVDDPERNSWMAADAWLNHVPIPADQIHPIPAERGALQGAADYARTLAEQGRKQEQEQNQGMDSFDLVLLGLGEDAHTASLFPGHDWGVADEAPDALAVFDAPKPPPERVSLSARRLSRTRQALFLVTGNGKKDAVAAWRSGEDIPARAISPPDGLDVFCTASLLAHASSI